LAGGGMQQMIPNKIQDDINIFIGYTLKLNQIIANILSTNKEICPMQIDLVIIGRDQVQREHAEHKDDANSDDDDDAAPVVNVSGLCIGKLCNPLPEHGLCAFLKSRKIEVTEGEVSLDNGAKSTRVIQEALSGCITERYQRVIMVIDRSAKRGCASEEGTEKLLVFSLECADTLRKDYSEEALSWLTKKKLFPDWKSDGDDEKARSQLKGGESDIGDAGFVVSFHVHEAAKVKVEQFLKTQKMPFLPHHMLDVWPMYFEEGKASEVDAEKYSPEKVYAAWKLQTRNATLNKWIRVVDPEYYKEFSRRHGKYEAVPEDV